MSPLQGRWMGWIPIHVGPRPYAMLCCPYRASITLKGFNNLARGLVPTMWKPPPHTPICTSSANTCRWHEIGVCPKVAIERVQSKARFGYAEREQARASLIAIRQDYLLWYICFRYKWHIYSDIIISVHTYCQNYVQIIFVGSLYKSV